MKVTPISMLCLLLLPAMSLLSQERTISVEGYVYEENNRGYIKNVKITILQEGANQIVAESKTDKNGIFRLELPVGKKYLAVAEKKLFLSREISFSTIAIKKGQKVYLDLELERKPGYIFDVTIAEPRRKGVALVQAIDSARIEIYNNTNGAEELVLENWPHPTFKFAFEQGNHYTIMIRRKGYFNKRIEAYVNVEGCILCFDGLGTVEPGVVDVMSHGLQLGTFLANIELEPLKLNQTYTLENIYYDFDKWNIRPDAARELNNLVSILKDNPAVTVELGSHTDARGADAYNLSLSQKRAASAVEYIVNTGVIAPENIIAKGYGETQLTNNCKNGVACSETNHQKNRRTELKVVGINEVDPLDNKTLRQIIEEENLLKEVMEQEPIQVDSN